MATTFGRYTLVRKLATGGMAEVFLASADGPMGFQKKCVVKRILPHFSDDPQFVQMFLGEARLAAELNHPNLVQIFDFGEVDGQYFIAMEFIDGPNLRVLNHELRSISGSVPLAAAARMITMAAEGLQFAHDLKDEHGQPINLVHRDISPDNILVSRQGTVKVVDFGIAKAANQVHLTKSGMIKGKLAYMPPEQLAREPLDRRSDVYALGVVLYELVCGVMPFDATSEVSIIQAIMGEAPLPRAIEWRLDMPPMLDAIIARCLEKDRERRYPSCRALQQELEQFIQASGSLVSVSDIAVLVEQVIESTQQSHPVASTAATLDPTVPRSAASSGPLPTPGERPRTGEVLAAPPTAKPTVERSDLRVAAAPADRATRTGLMVGLAVLVITLGSVLGYVLLRPPLQPPAIAAHPPTEPVAAPRVAVPPPVDSPPVVVLPVAVDATAVGAPDAGTPEGEVADRQLARVGRLELRVRPYATVAIDGREIGDTPLPPQVLTVGKHRVRLVNKAFAKDVELEISIRPGQNVLKHNFKD
jgi:serine/threonine protein kinase